MALNVQEKLSATSAGSVKKLNESKPTEDLLYDLTNTYFEGSKIPSQLAKYGRSKVKRRDAKLVVQAMVINIEGFIKYSVIHEGNYADTSDIKTLIEKLGCNISTTAKPIVVMDAGIATQKNLDTLTREGYKYTTTEG